MSTPTGKMRHNSHHYLWLEASRPPITLAVTTLPTFTDDVGKDPRRTSAGSTTSDTCTLPELPSSKVTWMQVGFTVRTVPCRISPKQWPLRPVWFSEAVRFRSGILRSHDTKGSPCSSWQLGSITSADKVMPAFSFSDSDRNISFRWLQVWITVSCAVSPNEMTAKSLSMCCTIAVYFNPSASYKKIKNITIKWWIYIFIDLILKKNKKYIYIYKHSQISSSPSPWKG